jgi:predicted adenylyl cyclase CyaB
MTTNNREIEVRFLEIDESSLVNKLGQLGAQDLGEELLKEVIFYGQGVSYADKKFVRLRQERVGIRLTFKHHEKMLVDGAREIEVMVSDFNKTREMLEVLGFTARREQEKKRHAFKLAGVEVDIITWPTIPTLVELEGASEQALKQAAAALDLDWGQVVLEENAGLIENRYHIPLSKIKIFTFSKIE